MLILTGERLEILQICCIGGIVPIKSLETQSSRGGSVNDQRHVFF